MFDDLPDRVPDDELAAILTAALRAGGGRINRALSCDLACIAAEHLVDRLTLAGVRAVRVRSRPDPS